MEEQAQIIISRDADNNVMVHFEHLNRAPIACKLVQTPAGNIKDQAPDLELEYNDFESDGHRFRAYGIPKASESHDVLMRIFIGKDKG